MKKFGKRIMSLTAVTMCLAMIMTGCGAAEEPVEQEEASVAVTTEEVGTGTLTLNNAFVGTISPEETVAVIPLAAGTVTETFFEVGDYVEAGDVLFQIDDEIAQIQATTAALSVQQAEQTAEMTSEVNRMHRIFSLKVQNYRQKQLMRVHRLVTYRRRMR